MMREVMARFESAMQKWLAIRPDREKLLSDDKAMQAAMAHSALLRRLLEGKEPFPYTPPLYNGHPWYDLLDVGYAVSDGVMVDDTSDTITIGGSVWNIVYRARRDNWWSQDDVIDYYLITYYNPTEQAPHNTLFRIKADTPTPYGRHTIWRLWRAWLHPPALWVGESITQ